MLMDGGELESRAGDRDGGERRHRALTADQAHEKGSEHDRSSAPESAWFPPLSRTRQVCHDGPPNQGRAAMIFMQFLKNLDELLFEIMSWLVFYPLTLWKSVVHPQAMMVYADAELEDEVAQQYTDRVSPPTFLLLTLLLSHLVELAAVGDSAIVASTRGLDRFIDSDANLLALRLVSFALFPLVMAARLLRRRGQRLERDALKLPFYSQCYVTAPLALAFSLAATLSQMARSWAEAAAAVIVGAAALWYVALQTEWFRTTLPERRGRALADALLGYGEALALLFLIGLLFA